MKKFKIGNTFVGQNSKTYFIADIAANHDGSLSRAKKLIRLCAILFILSNENLLTIVSALKC